ncbi:hypothetical protein F183_A21630 [Bryobacterales bacterium F-183]|nr:hypothetical protein F183_A21630 [Bryobacterales bacterium F-183]
MINDPRTQLPFERHHAFVIGINRYKNVSWLKTAVDDALRLADVLKTQQHFDVHPPLVEATGAEIRELLHTIIREKVGENDRVLFYFAGHGIAADGDDGPAGYLVPLDGDPDDVKSTFIPMSELQDALTSLPCRHLLLVLDCCFSGAFQWASRFRDVRSAVPKRIYKERFDRFVMDPAWQVITSAAYDQKALDVLDGKAIGDRGVSGAGDQTTLHSPFARALFEGLAGEADIKGEREGDGVITATELYAYIRDRIEPKTIEAGQELRQTPGFFPLKKHDKGEFVFLHPRHRLNLPPTPRQSPYKGLAAFEEDDQPLFYGRDRVVRELYDKGRANKLLLITGPTGVGKSSVIKAGLLPRLRRDGFRILPVIRPGAHPLAALEQALGDAAKPVPGGRQRTVLVVDQLEEVMTRCTDADERKQFQARLLQVLEQDQSIHRVIATVRSDFETQLISGKLRTDWMAGRCTVPPFSLEELEDAIVMPASQEVLLFEPASLVQEIISDVVQSPGALPLLSFALNELYEAYRASGRGDRALRKEDYDQLGGVRGALRARADGLYKELPPAEQQMMRKVLLRLVSVEADLASKRVAMADLEYTDAERPLVAAVVEKLIDARLIVKGEDYLEPAHDMLVRGWKRLQEWVQEIGRDKLILGAKLNLAANDFARSGDIGLLWDDNPYLPVAEQELAHPQTWLNAAERLFIQESVKRREDQARAAEREKVRVLLSLFASLDLHLTNGQPGSISVNAGDSGQQWIPISRLPAEVQCYQEPAQSRDFIVARHYGAGRVLVYAHDGLPIDGEITPKSDNLLFAENALRWLAADAGPHVDGNGMRLLFWEGSFHRWSEMKKVVKFVRRRQWSFEMTTPDTLEKDLQGAGVLWYASDWFPPEDFATRHVPLIDRFVKGGGGLLVGGLGWSYEQYPDQHPPVPYAANELGKPFGFRFTTDAFVYDASRPIPLLPGR